MYTLDTNAILYYVAGDQSVRELVDEALLANAPLYVSAITVAELLIFPKLSPEEEGGIRKFLSICSIILLDFSLADRAGSIGREYHLELADSIIAATALFTGSTLVTRNMRDFRRVPSLALQGI
ncbi:hypothetical protein A2851_03795 [Candidatus Kaiserbacteria bacterium RIFCSPHIGHO2_01_FULL_53_29]|uniref:Ribonuclease VapC n=1 Tax=Candidatus Kaiserbacteria bacterium RIFCSPHIGHO2_01_FULL_53_29 TaxID=1798480 RepID=A0A1F6CWK0_9BACT|nr:MAG: hypothetical protein A2851_03795 [Candidatus Kaiserbacteria bacterium RIFCSPHIGHO2_01_FULL_53_29]